MGSLNDFLSAIKSQESGGNHLAVNRNTGALGLYQVLPSNVGPWARKYLGINLSASQFLRSASMQERLVKAVMGDYVSRYGYRGAAAAWYSGNPALANNYNPQRWGPSIGSYVDSVMDRMGKGAYTMSASVAAEGVVQSARPPKPPANVLTDLRPISEMGQQETGDPLDAQTGGIGNGEGIGLDLDPPGSEKNPAPAGLAVPLGIDSGPRPPNGSNDATERPGDMGFATSSGRDSMIMAGINLGSAVGLRNPLPGFKITFGFGQAYGTERTAGSHHRGIDFAAKEGTRVFAPESGRIISARWEGSGFGLAIRYQAADGTYGILGHLSSIGNLKPGMTMKAGTFLGKVGNTGDSFGAHLHWEKRRDLYSPDTAYDFTDSIAW